MKFSGELKIPKNVKEDFFLQKIFPFFKAPLTSEGEAVEKTAAKMRVVAPVPRPQMMRKVFLVEKKRSNGKGIKNNLPRESATVN